MSLVWIVALGVVLVALVCVLLGAFAARRGGSDPDPLEWLMRLRSPSGKSFFATRESARELMASLEDVPDLEPSAREPSRRP
jgi:hypothetical protein